MVKKRGCEKMSSQKITLIIGIFILSFFVVFFYTQNEIFDKDERIVHLLNAISQAAQEKDWERAEQLYNEFEKLWLQGKYIVAINNGEQDYSDLRDEIYGIKKGIEVQDEKSVPERIGMCIGLWENMRKIIPEP